MKLVSIIIPVYNREKLIPFTLDSIIAQTYTHWECIVVDDGSTDDTFQVVLNYAKRDPRIKVYSRIGSFKSGGCGARNYGFSLSKGEYINWFDSDDIMLPDKLHVQVEHLEQSPFSMTVCQTLVFEKNPQDTKGLRCESVYSEDFVNDFIQNKIKWLTQAPLLRKSFILETGIRFNEDLKRSQERQFFVDILTKIDDYHYDSTPLVLYRIHPDRISFDKFDLRKLKSTLDVDVYILKIYRKVLNDKTISYLSTNIFRYMEHMLHLKRFKEANKTLIIILFNLKAIPLKTKISVLLGFFIKLMTGKGHRFFKA